MSSVEYGVYLLHNCDDITGLQKVNDVREFLSSRGIARVEISGSLKIDLAYKVLDQTEVVIVFVTKSFLDELNKADPGNAVYCEHEYAKAICAEDKIVYVSLEPSVVSDTISVDLSADSNMKDKFDDLYERIVLLRAETNADSSIGTIADTAVINNPNMEYKNNIDDYEESPKKSIGSESDSKLIDVESSEEATDNKLLTSLTVDEVILLLETLNIPHCEVMIRQNKIDGETLSYISTLQDFKELGLDEIPPIKKKILIGKVDLLKFTGVPQHLLLSNHSTSSSTSVQEEKSHVNFNKASSRPSVRNVQLQLPIETSPEMKIINDLEKSLQESISYLPDTIQIESVLQNIPDILHDDILKIQSIFEIETIIKYIIIILKECETYENICILSLSSISQIFTSAQFKENLIRTSEEACVVLLEVMRKYPNTSLLQRSAFLALSYIAFYKVNADKLISIGVYDTIVTATKCHVTDPKIIIYLLWTLTNLAKHENTSEFLGSHGISIVIVDIIRFYIEQKSPNVLEAGLNTLAVLADFEDNRVRLRDAGACDIISTILKDMTTVDIVLFATCRCIMRIACNNINNKILGDSGICEILVGLMTNYCVRATAIGFTCGALYRLMKDSDVNIHRCSSCGICEMLVLTLNANSTVPDVIKCICNNIVLLASDANNKLKFNSAGCQAILKIILKNKTIPYNDRVKAHLALNKLLLFPVNINVGLLIESVKGFSGV
eukprot:gene7229-14753_t